MNSEEYTNTSVPNTTDVKYFFKNSYEKNGEFKSTENDTLISYRSLSQMELDTRNKSEIMFITKNNQKLIMNNYDLMDFFIDLIKSYENEYIRYMFLIKERLDKVYEEDIKELNSMNELNLMKNWKSIEELNLTKNWKSIEADIKKKLNSKEDWKSIEAFIEYSFDIMEAFIKEELNLTKTIIQNKLNLMKTSIKKSFDIMKIYGKSFEDLKSKEYWKHMKTFIENELNSMNATIKEAFIEKSLDIMEDDNSNNDFKKVLKNVMIYMGIKLSEWQEPMDGLQSKNWQESIDWQEAYWLSNRIFDEKAYWLSNRIFDEKSQIVMELINSKNWKELSKLIDWMSKNSKNWQENQELIQFKETIYALAVIDEYKSFTTTTHPMNFLNFYKLIEIDAKKEEGKIENDDICDSYPYLLEVPRGTDENELKVVAKTRSKSRLPIYTLKSEDNKTHLLRGSMPILIKENLSLRNSPCKKYLDKCLAEDRKWMLIVDCRSKLAELVNIGRNGGFEKYGYRYYTVYLNIGNVDKVFSAFEQLTKLLLNQNDIQNFINKDFPKLEYTKFLRLIIDGAFLVADNLIKGVPVLVHCTRGYDRTPQITSLAKLMMKDEYRTVYGFIDLIYEDWITFSHKFSQKECTFPNFPRLFTSGKAEKKCARVFIQFLDVVHQIYEANQNKFEFQKQLLNDIANNMDHELFWFDKNSNRPDPEKSLEKFKDLFKEKKYFKDVYEVDDNFYYPSKLKLWKDYYCDKSCEKDVEDVKTENQEIKNIYIGEDIDYERKCYYITHLFIPFIVNISSVMLYLCLYTFNLTPYNFILYRMIQCYGILVINFNVLLMNNANIYIFDSLLLYAYAITCFIFIYLDNWWNHFALLILGMAYSYISIIYKLIYNILPVDNLSNTDEKKRRTPEIVYYY